MIKNAVEIQITCVKRTKLKLPHIVAAAKYRFNDDRGKLTATNFTS